MPDQSIKDVQANLSNMSTEELQVLLADIDEYPNRFVEHVGYDSAVEFCDAVIEEILGRDGGEVPTDCFSIPKPQKYTREVRRAAKSKSHGSRKRGNFSVSKKVVDELEGRAEPRVEITPRTRRTLQFISFGVLIGLALTLAPHFF